MNKYYTSTKEYSDILDKIFDLESLKEIEQEKHMEALRRTLEASDINMKELLQAQLDLSTDNILNINKEIRALWDKVGLK